MDSGWGSVDADVLSHVLQRLLPFPGQVGQCRLVCSGWKHAIARAQDVTVTLQHGAVDSYRCVQAETCSLSCFVLLVVVRVSWRLLHHGVTVP